MKKYYNILTTEGADEATILLYGYIGDWIGWDDEKGGWAQKGVTDIDFVKELEALAAKYNTIHVRINSPGGEIFHGSAIVTAIRNCAAEVHTWIDGVAASMAGVIWMAGKKRHMAKNAMLMIHSASGICWGNAEDMREMAGTLDAFDQSLITSCADSLGMTEDDMKKKYFDGKDHWLTWNDVSGESWLSADDDYKAAEDTMPEDVTKLSYRDLVAFFEKEKTQNNPQAPGFLQKVRAFFEETAALFGGTHTQPSPINTLDMNFEEFKTSIGDKTLDIEAVKAYLAEQTPPAEPAAPEPTPAPATPAPENTEIADLKAQIADLKALVAAWGAKPGEGKATPGMPNADLPAADAKDDAATRLAKAHAEYVAAAEKNEQVQFLP